VSGIPKEYADQYWADVDRELEEWFDDDPMVVDDTSDEDIEA
jgi:hypothetical protein